MLRMRGTESVVAREMYESLSDEEISAYGIDWDGPLPENDECSVVTLPETPSPSNADKHAEMCTSIDPLRQSNSYGIDIFTEVISFLSIHATQMLNV